MVKPDNKVPDSEINPFTVFSLMLLIFATLSLIQYVFIIFSIWSFTIGIILGYLLLKTYDEIPNLLLLLQVTGTLKGQKILTRSESTEVKVKGCGICSKKGCVRHKSDDPKHQRPWEDLEISKPVDDALAEFFEIVLNTHLYSWYRDLSHDQGFVDEVRCALHQAMSVVYHRIRNVKLSEFIIKRVLKKFMVHVDSFFVIKEQVTNKDDLQQAVLDHLKTYKHFCIQNESAEKEYLRYTVQSLLPYLLPHTSLNCKGVDCFLEELIFSTLLKPLNEKIMDPDFVNNILLIFLDESTLPEPDYKPSPKVKFLENFGKKRANYSFSSINLNTYELIHNALYLYPFMQFMKREGALNVLQFCLAVEEFNKRVLAAELTEEEETQIIEEAKEIDDLYFKSDAVDKINFPTDIINDFQNGGFTPNQNTIDRARAAAPLFRAYEHAVDILDKVYVPLFHQSDEIFELKCGDRNPKVKKSTDECSLAKRKFMAFADLSKITSRIRARKMLAKGEKLTSMDELDFPLTEEAYESYEDEFDPDNEEDHFDDNEMHIDSFDLNYCHITIPKMDFVLIGNKRCYVYIITVDVIGSRSDGELSQWQAVRKYNEFYVLDIKLRRFHEALNLAELPAKRTILKKDFDYLNSIRPRLQEYLQKLARSPALKGSSLLQRFLSPGPEIDGMFEPESVGREAGRKVKSLKNKLVIEKGQNLEKFLNSFINSAEPPAKKKIPPKPMPTHMMYSTHRRHDSLVQLPPPHWARELRRNLSINSDIDFLSPHSVSEYVLYVCRNLFKVPSLIHHILIFAQFLCKNTIDVFIEKFITYKILLGTAELQLISYIHLVRDAIFFDSDPPRTDSDKVERRDCTLQKLLNYLPNKMRNCIGPENHDQAMRTMFEMFQYPRLNKQLFYILFDELMYELFPELNNPIDDKI